MRSPRANRASAASSSSWEERSWKSTTSADRGGFPGFLLFIVFAAAALLLYGTTLGAWFQEDDFDILYRVSSHGPFGIWTHGPTNFFRPVISASFWAQYQAWNLNPLPYRIFNLLLYAGSASLLSCFVFELSEHRERILAVCSGLLFLCLPSHVETANWIAARTDLCSTFFAIASLYGFSRWARTRSTVDLLASLSAFAVGVFSKESVVLVPAIALFLYFRRLEGSRWKAAGFGFACVLAIYGVCRFILMGTALKGNLERSTGLKLVGATAVQVARSLLPGFPAGDPTLNNTEAIRSTAGILYVAAGVLVLSGSVIAGRKLRTIPEGRMALAYAVALLPVLGLSLRLFRSQGERFIYFPSAFAVVILVGALAALLRDRRRVAAVTGILAAVGSFLVYKQNLVWLKGAELSRRVQVSFVNDVLSSAGGSPIVLFNVPTRIQGSYAVAYVFDSVAPLFRGQSGPEVRVASMLQLSDSDHAIASVIENGLYVAVPSPASAKFSLEDTLTGTGMSSDSLSNYGYSEFDEKRVTFDLRALAPGTAAYAWDGRRFWALRSLPSSRTK